MYIESAVTDQPTGDLEFDGELAMCEWMECGKWRRGEPVRAVRQRFGAPIRKRHGASVGPLIWFGWRSLVQAIDIDLESPDVVRNPYPYFTEWRRAGKPLFHNGLGMHLVFTHADANAVLRSKALGRIWKDKEPDDLWNTFNWLHSDSILESEPPKHTRLRALVAKAFLRGQIERLRPAVMRIADDLIDAAIAKLKECGVSQKDIYFDKFTDKSHIANR